MSFSTLSKFSIVITDFYSLSGILTGNLSYSNSFLALTLLISSPNCSYNLF